MIIDGMVLNRQDAQAGESVKGRAGQQRGLLPELAAAPALVRPLHTQHTSHHTHHTARTEMSDLTASSGSLWRTDFAALLRLLCWRVCLFVCLFVWWLDVCRVVGWMDVCEWLVWKLGCLVWEVGWKFVFPPCLCTSPAPTLNDHSVVTHTSHTQVTNAHVTHTSHT